MVTDKNSDLRQFFLKTLMSTCCLKRKHQGAFRARELFHLETKLTEIGEIFLFSFDLLVTGRVKGVTKEFVRKVHSLLKQEIDAFIFHTTHFPTHPYCAHYVWWFTGYTGLSVNILPQTSAVAHSSRHHWRATSVAAAGASSKSVLN